MKSIVGAIFVAVAALLIAPQTASASTYEAYHCGCTAPTGESCSCNYGYTLGKLATKEFRGYCDNIGGSDPYAMVNVGDRNKNTTCTIWAKNMIDKYGSRSCTNWSLTSNDSLDIETVCTNEEASGADL